MKAPDRAALPVPLLIRFNQNGWNVYRALRDRGLRPVILDDDPGSIYWKARQAELVCVPHLESPAIVDALNELARDGRRYVLVSSPEATTLALDAARDRLHANIHLEFPPSPTLRMLLDKKAFYRRAVELGFDITPMHFIDAAWRVSTPPESIRFPCILKGRVKLFVAGLAKAYQITGRAELEETLERISALDGVDPGDLVLQEWVPGGDDAVIFCMQYYGAQDRPLMSFTGRKLRQWRPLVGGTATALPYDSPEALELSTRFFTAVGMQGLCSMEFKRSAADGKLYLIEPTVCRADFQEGVAVANGCNLPYALYAAAAGLPVPAPAPPRKPVLWVSMLEDYCSARHYVSRGELTWAAWLGSLRGPKAFAVFDLREPGPFVEIYRRKLRARLSSFRRRP